MFVGVFNLTIVEFVIIAVVGAATVAVPIVGVLIVLRVFNEYETQRRSEIVDQALTRDAEIAPLPPADEPAGNRAQNEPRVSWIRESLARPARGFSARRAGRIV